MRNMKLVCISEPSYSPNGITIGKIYDAKVYVSKNLGKIANITNDEGDNVYHYFDQFITLEEYRSGKLIELGI